MKKFLFIVMTALFLLAASGCNQSQKAALQATIDKSVQEEKTFTLTATEDCGRYCTNHAVWKVICRAILIKRT